MNMLIHAAARLQSAAIPSTLFWIAVKATLILAIARLLLIALPRASAATKHLIATAALCAAVALPVFTVVVPRWNVPLLTAKAVVVQPEGPIGTATAEEAPISPLRTAVTLAKETHIAERPVSFAARFIEIIRTSWAGMLVLALLGGALAFVLQLIGGTAAVWLVARNAEPIDDDATLLELDSARDHLALGRDVRLLRSSRIRVPIVWGIFRPVLLLPAEASDWTGERLRVVLLHELAHVRRLDVVSLIATRLAVAVYWFHPLAWSLERAGRGACERACDDLVLASGTKASEYAEHLLSIARGLPRFDPFRAVTLAMSRRSQLEGRLLSILQSSTRRAAFGPRAVAVACAFAMVVILPLSAFHLVAAPAPEPGPKPSGATITVKPAPADETDTHERGYWYKRGMQFHESEKFVEAIDCFRKSIDEGFKVDSAKYNIACGFARMDDAPSAVRWLQDAVDSGSDAGMIESDSDFDPIRNDPQFQQFVKEHTGSDIDQRLEEALNDFANLKIGGDKAKDDSWFSNGYRLLKLRQYDQAIAAFEEAIRTNDRPGTAMYNIACAEALQGHTGAAMQRVHEAIENGFDACDHLMSDGDLSSIRDQAGFDELKQFSADLSLIPKGMKGNDPEEWARIAARHREIAQRYPRLGRPSFNLGFALLQAHDYAGAIAAYQHTIDLGYRKGASSYNIACAYAQMNQPDPAFAWLDKARALGFNVKEYVAHDDDLDNLRDDPRLAAFEKS